MMARGSKDGQAETMRSPALRLAIACVLALFGGQTGPAPVAAQGSTHVKTMPAPPPAPKSKPAKDKTEPRSETKPAPPPPAQVGPVVADAASVTGDGALTRLALDLTGPIEYQVFRLQTPDRVVIDVTNVEFTIPPATGRNGAGLVSGYRFGAFAPGRSRLVIETAGPVQVEATRLIREGARGRHRLELDLVPARSTELSESEVAAARESAARLQLSHAAPPVALPAKPSPAAPSAPLIIIDPGHGGVDSGAQGAVGVEKDIVLAVGRALEKSLLATGRYRVMMTRADDTFVPLERRIRISREQEAQLFISLHADSLEARELAHTIRGATIYTLSQSASDERARRLADKENSADLLAGAHLPTEIFQDDVKSILFDLMARESAGLSLNFRQFAIKRLRGNITFSRDPQRSANFLVLRQAETPAVLIELGYISNPDEEKLMLAHDWQRKIAGAITAAVNDFFTSSGAIFR